MEPIVVLLLFLVTALLMGEIVRLFRLPMVLGYLGAGFLLGAIGIGEPGEIIIFLKELGIVFLFFFIGLGIKLDEFKKSLRSSLSLGFWASIIPFIFGMVFAALLGLDLISAFIVGFCVSISAQAVCIMILHESGLLKKKLGKEIVEAGIVADILQLLGVGVLFAFIPQTSSISLPELMLNWLILFGAILLIKMVLFPLLQRTLKHEHDPQIIFFLSGIIIAGVMGYVAEILGIGSIMGALVAGVMIRQFFEKRIVDRLLKDFRLIAFGFLVPILFVWTGYITFTVGVATTFVEGSLLALIAIIGAVIGASIALRRNALKERILAGMAMGTKGDMEIILAAVMLETGVIGSQVFSLIIMMSLVTMLLAPTLFYMVSKRDWKEAKRSI